jgi:hypothetical protein
MEEETVALKCAWSDDMLSNMKDMGSSKAIFHSSLKQRVKTCSPL